MNADIPKSIFTAGDFEDPNQYNLVKEVSIKVRQVNGSEGQNGSNTFLTCILSFSGEKNLQPEWFFDHMHD